MGTLQQDFALISLEKVGLSALYNTNEGYRGNEASCKSDSASASDVFAYNIGITHSGSAMEPHETTTRWTISILRSTKLVGCWVGIMPKTAPV